MGMPPAYGRLLGWLLICDPPQQTSAQLGEALGLSKGSVSSGMRMLERSDMVQRVPTPGRGHAYEMLPDALVRATDPAVKFAFMRDVMQRGLSLLDENESTRAERLRVSRDFYGFIAEKLPSLMEEFRQKHLRKDQ
ncbi:GbsR/MarR family transcriptional regulator [Rhizocola hellebori]|nr:MarR family transcriptional regulator [Rhizocola hellebori]